MSYEPGLGFGSMYGRTQGFVGDSVSGITKITAASGATTLFVSHNGQGPTRPGFSEATTAVMQRPGLDYTVLDTTLIDVLPSNVITALVDDWWGVHIATDEGPMMHWNGATGEMEQGASRASFADWPIRQMSSDGQNILAVSNFGVDRISSSNPMHPATRLTTYGNLVSSVITQNGLYVVGADGLHIWGQSPAFVKQDRDSILRSEPLMINFGGTAFDVTDEARPGNQIVLVDANNPVTLPGFGTAGPANIPMTQDLSLIHI